MSMIKTPNISLVKRSTSTYNDDLNSDEITCEEKHKDAIYQVTYRKIYNNNPTTIIDNNQLTITNNNVNGKNDGLIYSKIKIKQIKFGTIEKLIDSFTNDIGELDSNTTYTFLATYRTFTNIKDAFRILFNKYKNIFPASLDMTEEIRIAYSKSFRSIITTWLDSYLEDFDDPPKYTCLSDVESFCVKYIPESIELINYIGQKRDFLIKKSTSINKLIGEQLHNKLIDRNQLLPNKQPTIQLYNSKSELNLANLNHTVTFRTTNSTITSNSNAAQNNQIHHHPHHTRSSSNSNIIIATSSITNISQLNQTSNCMNTVKVKSISFPILSDCKFIDIDEYYFAQQLTYIDKELFQKVIPYHCLGAIWGLRKKQQSQLNNNSSSNFETINAFIEQFNVITFIVQGTVLEKNVDYNPSASKRAKIIEKWIRIALYLRNLKNFSSLNAIVQGLDTQCVSRLEKTWNEVSNDYKTQFNELVELFSQDNNQQLFRETLMKEGTAKSANINLSINATLSRKAKEKLMKQRNSQTELLGTVPFLGTFLRDLEYIHAQNPTKNEDGLINFAKKRKEFEIIAQIKLLQRAAQFYKIDEDPLFKNWLLSLPSFKEEVNYDLSYQIEPRADQYLPSISNCSTSSNNNNNNADKKTKSSLSRSSRCESFDSLNSANLNTNDKTNENNNNNNNNNNNSNSRTHRHSRNSSNCSGSDIYMNNSTGSYELQHQTSYSPTTKSFIIVKVNINDPTIFDTESLSSSQTGTSVSAATTQSVHYKKISIKDSDRTKDVKRSILNKFLLDPDRTDRYNLLQTFNDGLNKDILINDNCNVFYALKQVNDMQLLLKLKDLQSSTNSLNSNNSNTINNSLNSSNRYSPRLKLNNNGYTTTNNPNASLPPPAPNHDGSGRRGSWQIFKNILH